MAKPGQVWLDRRLAIWVSRLGLERWDIKLLPDFCDEDANASTWRSNTYDRATIKFSCDLPTWTFGFAETVLVHELLHLCHRDIDQVLGDLDGQLQRDAWLMVERRYEHAMEGFIERLACRLVEIGGV